MPRFKDQAVCIRHLDWSETSQVVVLFTFDHGKIRGLAKGSKRTSPGSIARFSGGIELLTCGEIVGITKTGVELATLTEWDLQNPYPHLRRDLAAQRLGLYAADVVHAMTADADPHPVVFQELMRYLDAIADAPSRPAALLRFQWRLLADVGYRPELEIDVVSGGVLPAKASYSFDPIAGGVTAQSAIGGGKITGVGPWKVRRETVELLRHIAAGGDAAAEDAEAAQRANRLLCVYIRAILDRPLATMEFVLG